MLGLEPGCLVKTHIRDAAVLGGGRCHGARDRRGVLAYRDFSMRDTVDAFLRTAGVIVVAVLGWTWIDQSAQREHAAERRALDARASELTARVVAPGSVLACLTPVGIETVDAACEQAVFASPQTVAAAVAYVDAQLCYWPTDWNTPAATRAKAAAGTAPDAGSRPIWVCCACARNPRLHS
jgi:hypothetical protein